jgi:hypothetical protein
MAPAKKPGSSRRFMVMLSGTVVAALMLASTGAAWAAGGSEDNRRPVIKDLSPAPGTLAPTNPPTIEATVRDAKTDLAKKNIRLCALGNQVTDFSYDRSTDRLTYTYPIAVVVVGGDFTAKIVAKDRAGNVSRKSWSFPLPPPPS